MNPNQTIPNTTPAHFNQPTTPPQLTHLNLHELSLLAEHHRQKHPLDLEFMIRHSGLTEQQLQSLSAPIREHLMLGARSSCNSETLRHHLIVAACAAEEYRRMTQLSHL